MELPLIAAQPGIWLADKLSSFDNTYSVVHYVDLSGNLVTDILIDAIMKAMQETDTLQMSYEERDGSVVQIMGSAVLPSPEVYDLQGDTDPEASAKEFMKEDMRRSVRLDSGNTLIRHAILQIGKSRWYWYQRYHHIQLDAYSFTALTRRTVDIYSSNIKGTVPQHTAPSQSLKKAVEEYQTYSNSEKRVKDAQFWKEVCNELPEANTPSSLPLSGTEPSVNIIRNSITIDKDDFAVFSQHAALNGLQDADVALALICVWLLRITSANDMGIGFIFMRRLGSAALHTSGPFINVLPLLISLQQKDGSPETLISFAKTLSKKLKAMRRHQKYDSEMIIRDSGRNWDDNPPFGPVINFKAFDYSLNFEDIEYETHHIASGPIRDIEIVLYLSEEKHLKVEYLANSSRYNAAVLDAHLRRLKVILDALKQDVPNSFCQDVNILLAEEMDLIESTNSTVHTVDTSMTLAHLLSRQTQLSASSVALQDTSISLTYAEMSQQVYSLARKLREAGSARGDIVAVAVSRSVLLAIAHQAVIYIGAAYLPLDPSYPKDRLQFMIQDSGAKLLLANSIYQDLIENAATNVILFDSLSTASTDEDPKEFSIDVFPEDVAYVIYTSGSTGKPKGVQITHSAIVNRLLWMQHEYNLGPQDAVLQKTPSSFDVSVWEFFWPPITGARLFLSPPGSERDPEELSKCILQYGITTMHFVPSMMATFLTLDQVAQVTKGIRRVFCSGEALPTSLARKWQNVTSVPLYNLYGPTEAAVDVTSYPAFGNELKSCTSSIVPIGKPIWNTQVYVLDENLNMVPPGVAGNLYLAGVQLAKGYLNRPGLTSERFILANGLRLYQTGDVAMWSRKEPVLHFLGRSDDQVKLRGQRIELKEIDNAIESLPGIAQAVTHAQLLLGNAAGSDVDSRQLVGYVVSEPSHELNLSEILDQLKFILPSYMVPVTLMELDKLPLSANGKLDRRALPQPNSSKQAERSRAPAPGIERLIADAFLELLPVERDISADDDFFTLGGHSLLAVKLAAILRNRTGLPVSVGQIMQTPRISALADQLSDESNLDGWKDAGYDKLLPLRNNKSAKRKLFCLHPASGFAWQFSVLRRYIDKNWSIIGIQSAQLDGVLASSHTLEEVVDSHYNTLLAEEPMGPYYLLGYSLGGTLAHALAAKLSGEGREVAFLGLLDTWPPETQNWDEKRKKNVVDQAVIDEMYRERQQFIDAQMELHEEDGQSQKLFDIIERNYESAVRLLTSARSRRFKGTATLFVAQHTFPEGTDLNEVWRPWVEKLDAIPVECSHVDIISPKSFATLGPRISQLLVENIDID